ncbi:MAG: type II CAAX prenyl endopeptidase Rce1 family protein [Ruminococcus sp.]
MKQFDIAQLSDETDIADLADAPMQTAAYNQVYREWRCREGNLFAFRGKLKQNLHTYVDGIGVRENVPAKRERLALHNVFLLMAGVVLIYALAENVLVLPLMLLLKTLGIEISYSFNDRIAYGNQYAVLCVLLFETLLKYLLPVWLVHTQVKMPRKAAYPLAVRDKWCVGADACSMCIGFFAVSLLRLLFPVEIFNVNNIGMSYEVISYMDAWCSTFYLIFKLAITPILAEVLLHGMLFQVLRQFGVSYAVLLTAFLNAMVLHDPVAFLTTFVTAVLTGYGVWQSGSLLTGIWVRMLSRTMSFLLFESENFPSLGRIPGSVWFLLLVLLVGALGWGLLSLSSKKKWTLRDYVTFLPMRTKAKAAACSMPMLAVWILCFLLMMIEIFS